MKVGLILPNILSPANDAETLIQAAKLAEDAGFDSVWAADHILMPAEHRNYGNGLEILITLAYIAAQTHRVQLGTGILLLPLRNPLLVAKQFATLDVLSGGRTLFGVGVGWNAEEFGFLNADFTSRGQHMEEYLDIVYELWQSPSPKHQGSFNFENVIAEPKPKRLPPLYVGGNSDAALKRAALRGDAWIPGGPIENLAERAAHLRELAGERQVHIAMTLRADMRDGAQAVLDKLMGQIEQGLEEPTIRFIHESRADLIWQIEQFSHDVLPKLSG